MSTPAVAALLMTHLTALGVPTVTIGTSHTPVYASPHKEARIVGHLPYGARVGTAPSKGPMVRVSFEGASGYVDRGVLMAPVPQGQKRAEDIALAATLTAPVYCTPERPFVAPNCRNSEGPDDDLCDINATDTSHVCHARRAHDRLAALERLAFFEQHGLLDMETGKIQGQTAPVTHPMRPAARRAALWTAMLDAYRGSPGALKTVAYLEAPAAKSPPAPRPADVVPACLAARLPPAPKAPVLRASDALGIAGTPVDAGMRLGPAGAGIRERYRPAHALADVQSMANPSWALHQGRMRSTEVAFTLFPLSVPDASPFDADPNEGLAPAVAGHAPRTQRTRLIWEQGPIAVRQAQAPKAHGLAVWGSAGARATLAKATVLTHTTDTCASDAYTKVRTVQYDLTGNGKADMVIGLINEQEDATWLILPDKSGAWAGHVASATYHGCLH